MHAVFMGAQLIEVNLPVVDEGSEHHLPGVRNPVGVHVVRLFVRIAVDLGQIEGEGGKRVMIDREIRVIGRKVQYAPGDLRAGMQPRAVLERSFLEQLRSLIAGPPGAAAHPFAVVVVLEGQADPLKLRASLPNQTRQRRPETGRNALVGIEVENPVVLDILDRQVSQGIEVIAVRRGQHQIGISACNCGGFVVALIVDDDDPIRPTQ